MPRFTLANAQTTVDPLTIIEINVKIIQTRTTIDSSAGAAP
jgi:hypothetical protein